MKRLPIIPVLAIAFAAVAPLCGCQQEATVEPATAAQSEPQAAPAGGGQGGGVAPLSPAAGGLSPVVGTESMQGGGSAAGTVLKGKAKEVAGQAPSSLDQLDSGDGN